MAAGGPVFNMIKAPWYGSLSVAGLILGGNLLLFITAVGGWIYASLVRFIRKEKSSAPKPALAGRIAAAACCLLLLALPYFILLSSAAMLIFTVLAWLKKYWTRGARIHYTLLTLSSLGFIWLMLYVNLL